MVLTIFITYLHQTKVSHFVHSFAFLHDKKMMQTHVIKQVGKSAYHKSSTIAK